MLPFAPFDMVRVRVLFFDTDVGGCRHHHLSPKMSTITIKMASKDEKAELAVMYSRIEACQKLGDVGCVLPEVEVTSRARTTTQLQSAKSNPNSFSL